MAKEPNIIIYKNLVEPIEVEIKELEDIIESYNKKIDLEPYFEKGLFAYIIARFEGSITECVERFLFAFPDKLPKGKIDFEKHRHDIVDSNFSYEIMALLIEEYINENSYDKSENFIQTYCGIMSIENLGDLYSKSLIEKKARRNLLMHNNLKIDSKYIKVTKCDPSKRGTYLVIDRNYIIESINSVKQILEKMRDALKEKYSSLTVIKAIKDIWRYTFNALEFDNFWITNKNEVFFNSASKKHFGSISSSERTLLCYWIQNYSPSLCDELFKFKDLNMQVSNNYKMIYLVSIFDRFPLLLQNSIR